MNLETAGAESKEAATARLLLLSALVGAAAAYAIFVLFLQTAVVSLVRLGMAIIILAGISVVHYWFASRWLHRRLRAPSANATLAVAFALVLTSVFLPLLYGTPAFPLSPLLRPWADLAVQFEVPGSSAPLLLPQDSVRLVLDREVLNAGAFNLVGNWEKSGADLRLQAGTTGSLQWTGTVPDTITLAIEPPATDCALTIYWNNIRTSSRLHAGDPQVLIVEKSSLPWGYSLLLFLSIFVLVTWILSVLGILLAGRVRALERLTTTRDLFWVIVVLSVGLGALTVKLQIDSLNGGMQYLTTTQLVRHTNVLQGRAPDPWQYRVLSEWIAELSVRLARLISAPNAIAIGFIALRFLQNLAIFLLAFALYKTLSRSNLLAVLGILLLAGSMANAYYDNDLAFNTYFDVTFYLLCGLLLLSRKHWTVVILALFAALNRETSGLIPFLMAAAILEENDRPGFRRLAPALVASVLFVGVFFGLRWLYPDRPLYVPYKHPPGPPLFLYNVTRLFTWDQLWRTLGLAPLLSLASLPLWPRLWKWFFLILCPIWFVIHSFASVMAETRLFLVPQSLIFIPGALFLLGSLADPRHIASPSFFRPGAS